MFTHSNRRTFLSAITATGASIVGGNRLFAQDATPDAHDHDHDHDHDHGHEHDGAAYLLVGDPESRTLAVYNASDYTLIETIEDVVVNSHAGTIPLADGSVLLVDDEQGRLLHIEVHGDHLHVHEASTPGTVAHIAIDSDHAHYCAVGTSGEDEFQLHLVNLETWDVTSVAIPDAAEVGLFMTHDHVFHRNSNLNQVESYAISDLVAGNVEMLSSVSIGTFGHGEAVNESTGELFALTDDGVDVLYVEEGRLEHGKTFSWPDAEPAARGYFARLINDGQHLLTYTSDRSAPETEWNTWKNRVVLYDIATGEPMVTELPDGYTFRYGLANEVAIFVVIGTEGDVAISIDTNAENDTFGTIVSTTNLTAMTGGAEVGEPFYEVGGYRAAAVLPDARAAFITQGGDSVIEVIDPIHGEATASVQHAGTLTGGGTLAVFGPAVPFSDTIGR